MSPITKKYGLVLAGGGIMGTAHAGAVFELMNNGYEFDYFVGSSVGSFVCAVLACRCKPEKIRDIMMELDYGNITKGSDILEKVYDVYEYRGLYPTKNLRELYIKAITDVCGDPNITFQGVYDRYGSHLAMTATDVKLSKTIYFDRFTQPNMSILDACVHSATVPFLFESDKYVDGGLLNNYPINYMHNLIGIESTIGLSFKTPPNDTKYSTDIVGFTHSIVNMILDQAFKLHLSEPEFKNTIFIKVPNISHFDFNISKEIKEELYKCGIIAVKNSHF